jgi:uncharacterized protein YecT (DUF1311 family)
VGGAVVAGVAIASSWLWSRTAIHVSPSFDCTKATLATEKTICSDPELARLDADFAVQYQDSLKAVAIARDAATGDALEQGQRDFLEERNQCGNAKWCIERMYGRRNLQITELVGEPQRRVQRTVTLPSNVAALVAPLLRAAAVVAAGGKEDAYAALNAALASILDSHTLTSTEALAVLLGFNVDEASADAISCELVARGEKVLPALYRYANVIVVVPGMDMSLARRVPSEYSVVDVEGRIKLGEHCKRGN